MDDPVYDTVAEAVASIRVNTLGLGASWLRMPNVSLFIRIGKRLVDKERVETLEIATVDVLDYVQGRGVFRNLLLSFEKLAAEQKRVLILENVISERLRDAMDRRVARGEWYVLHLDVVPSYYKPWKQE